MDDFIVNSDSGSDFGAAPAKKVRAVYVVFITEPAPETGFFNRLRRKQPLKPQRNQRHQPKPKLPPPKQLRRKRHQPPS
jgi:hypothetical protein